MPKPTDYDKTHLRNMAAIGTRIDRIFKKAAEEAAKIGVSIKSVLPDDKIFSFDDYPATEKQIERLMTALKESMETTIVNGVRSAWTLSNNKNNALVSRIFGDHAKDLSKEQYRRYFSTNGAALEAFLQRQEQGLNLSDRVWKYTNAFKREIELGLDLGIRTGESAAQMTRSLRQYLQHPDKLFRRVRDKHGNLKLSKAASEFHPGRGVYRSSYKNARRLAATETNIAYRTSDHLRWQQMDFVVGIEIKLSNNHTLNGVPLTDICDTLAGRYPKDFKFTGWHPHCRCHAVSILKTEDEMEKDTERILAGEKPTKDSVNTVRDVPAAFKDWVVEHSDRIEMGGNLPYFIRDNRNIVGRIISMGDDPRYATIVKVGNTEYTLKQLISECHIVETQNGKIYVHPDHGKNELEENLEFARWRAELFGEEVILIPNPQHVKSADSFNITRGVLEEYKRSVTPSKNSIDSLLREGSKQAGHIILEIDSDIRVGTLQSGIRGRVTQNSHIEEIRLKVGDAEAVYTRHQILAKDFKIKPEDFHDVSVSRSEAESRDGRSADAKLQKLFGLNKKSIEEIAAERHAKRNADAIQQAWNERRIANIKQAIADGYLPKECADGLSSLPQEQFNDRIAFLQKRASAHAARTPEEIQAIKDAWAAKLKRDATTKLIANNVLKVAQDWQEVDFSVLEKIIANNNLGAMREEAKKVAQAIKAMRDQENALADLIPDVHGWHKQFSIAELKTVHNSIEAKLAEFKAKGWGDFETKTNVAHLKHSLEWQANYMATKGQLKYKTWEVAQKSYLKLVDKAQDLIDWDNIVTDISALKGFKTKSTEFADLLNKAIEAHAAGDKKKAQFYAYNAGLKKSALEAAKAKREATKAAKAASTTEGAVRFGDECFTEARRKAATIYANAMEAELSGLFDEASRLYQAASDAFKEAAEDYTLASGYLTKWLRGMDGYLESSLSYAEKAERHTRALSAVIGQAKLKKDMWLYRDERAAFLQLKAGGLDPDKLQSQIEEYSRKITARYKSKHRRMTAKLQKELDEKIAWFTDWRARQLEGKRGIDPSILSCGSHKNHHFSGTGGDNKYGIPKVRLEIYCPQGTQALYAAPFNHYNGKVKSGKYWNGTSHTTSIHEAEIFLQRDTEFRIIEARWNAAEDRWFIKVEVLGHRARDFEMEATPRGYKAKFK